ncbi:pilus assembly PilX family protein [Roseateles chitinivorans]|uniref:pilus assembly PilX family protein n=1 Tax=Roseateles chitinivorans TaxID=2917965 RepID=UPI003D67BBA8
MRPTTMPFPLSRQRGVIMVIALITLSVLLIGAAVAMRSMSVTLSSVGNFGFKRDMANRAELAVRAAATVLSVGDLKTEASRENSNAAFNYSATMLPTDASGIPQAMLNIGSTPATMNGAGSATKEISLPDDGLRIHYLIERLCNATGAFDKSRCLVAGNEVKAGSDKYQLQPKQQPMYRITVRVMGPHDAYSFFQTTYTTQLSN